MQEIGVRGPASAAGLLHHHVHHVHRVHHQLSSAHADVNTSDNETSTAERHSSGEEEGSSSSCHSPIDLRYPARNLSIVCFSVFLFFFPQKCLKLRQ
jgi:hypothetical protein